MNNYKWSLAVNTFNLWDRLRICSFFLNFNNRWTQGNYVYEYESIVQQYTGVKHAIFVSSGSSANQLICQQIKDRLVRSGEWPHRNKVIVNAVTWQTNVSVWIREGFEPLFIDVNLKDFCLDYDQLEEHLKDNESIACVFPTSVLGYVPKINRLKELEIKYPKVKFALDNCENFFGKYCDNGRWRNICYPFTCSTSGFIAHHINSGAEAGLILTNNTEEFEYFVLARAHGLRRNLEFYNYNILLNKYTNDLVDSQFDFQVLSSNYRSSDIMAFLSILDSKKWKKNRLKRRELYGKFYHRLDLDKYILPYYFRKNCSDVAFCLPIIVKNSDEKRYERIKATLSLLNIEFRPFISGNMLRQKNYQQYGDYRNFKNAEYLNNFGMYIGIHTQLGDKEIFDVCNELNRV